MAQYSEELYPLFVAGRGISPTSVDGEKFPVSLHSFKKGGETAYVGKFGCYLSLNHILLDDLARSVRSSRKKHGIISIHEHPGTDGYCGDFGYSNRSLRILGNYDAIGGQGATSGVGIWYKEPFGGWKLLSSVMTYTGWGNLLKEDTFYMEVAEALPVMNVYWGHWEQRQNMGFTGLSVAWLIKEKLRRLKGKEMRDVNKVMEKPYCQFEATVRLALNLLLKKKSITEIHTMSLIQDEGFAKELNRLKKEK